MNAGYSYRTQVQRASSLLDWLCEEYPHSDRAAWERRVLEGEVSVERRPGAQVRRNEMEAGDLVTWARPPWEEPPVPLSFAVCFEDDDVLVVDKPSGLPTMPAGGFLDHTLLTLVRRRLPDASPMHRLGRGTSGLVVFGKTELARRRLQASWRDGRVEKTYRALVVGQPAERLTIDAPIGPVEHPRLGSVHAAVPADSRGARRAVSHVRVVEMGPGGTPGGAEHVPAGQSWVDVDIDTGRPHQIRIHLAFSGHPLVGDPLYGAGGVPRSDALPGDLGYQLRAWRIRFPDPAAAGGDRVVEVSPAWPAFVG